MERSKPGPIQLLPVHAEPCNVVNCSTPVQDGVCMGANRIVKETSPASGSLLSLDALTPPSSPLPSGLFLRQISTPTTPSSGYVSEDFTDTESHTDSDCSELSDFDGSDNGTYVDDEYQIEFAKELDDSFSSQLPQFFQAMTIGDNIPDNKQATAEVLLTTRSENYAESDSSQSSSDDEQEMFADTTVTRWIMKDNPNKTWVTRSRKMPEEEEWADKLVDTDNEEAEILEQLHHKNIIGFKGYTLTIERPYQISTLYMTDGGTRIDKAMLKIHQKNEEQTLPALINYATQLCDGLSYLHSKKIMHRDISPGNILINTDQALNITDFGLASDCTGSFPDDPRGAAEYASPEAKEGKTQSYSADIFSAGRVMMSLMEDCNMLCIGWRRTYCEQTEANKETSDKIEYQLNLTDRYQNNPVAIQLLELIQSMVAMEPKKRPTATQLQLQFKTINEFKP